MDTIRDAVKQYDSTHMEDLSSLNMKALVMSERKVRRGVFYVAARFGRQAEAKELAVRLQEMGHRVTSTWIDQQMPEMFRESDNDVQTTGWAAQKDLDEVSAAEVMLYLSEEEDNEWGRGGRHVEFGFALGLGKSCWIIGPLENLFHYLHGVVQFESTEAFFQYLTED